MIAKLLSLSTASKIHRTLLTVHRRPANTAFVSVSARQVFERPSQHNSALISNSQSAISHTPQAEKSKRDWPDPVRQYVQRAFAQDNNIPGVSRQEMEAKLKHIIAESASNNTLHTVDWFKLPLPQQVIQTERATNAISGLKSNNPQMGTTFPSTPMQETNIIIRGDDSKKRKSTDSEPQQIGRVAQPPWRAATSERNVFEDRISYPDKRPRNQSPGKISSKSQHHLENRKKRFEDARTGYVPFESSTLAKADVTVDEGPVIGQCQDLEKKYFRLTAAPNPLSVRPLVVLEKTLDFLKKKWRKENNYSYICDQFKSLRQDLTVQHIKNEFTVNVYEIHARIALEKGDLGEYNQCQTQLRALYSQHLGGHPTEFKAYRILYFIHTCNRTDMNDVLADLTPTEKKDVAVKHALDARSALALGNYHKFFQLYLETPNMGAYLMDMFVARERLAALSNLCKSLVPLCYHDGNHAEPFCRYKPDVKLRFITEELGFESDDESARFICEHGGQNLLDERDGEVRLLTGKAVSFFEPAKQAAFRKVDIKGQI